MPHTIRSTGCEIQTTGPPIDLAGLRREMGVLGLDDLVDELVEVFVDDARMCMAALEAACDNCDPVAIRRAAHAFKSAAVTVYAHPLAALLIAIETAGRDGDAAHASDQLPEARREHEAVLAYCSSPPQPDRPTGGDASGGAA